MEPPPIQWKAPALFFLQPVRVNSGEGANQRSFSMVHMAGDTNGDVLVHIVASQSQWRGQGESNLLPVLQTGTTDLKSVWRASTIAPWLF